MIDYGYELHTIHFCCGELFAKKVASSINHSAAGFLVFISRLLCFLDSDSKSPWVSRLCFTKHMSSMQPARSIVH